jgi:hypothetical protein
MTLVRRSCRRGLVEGDMREAGVNEATDEPPVRRTCAVAEFGTVRSRALAQKRWWVVLDAECWFGGLRSV